MNRIIKQSSAIVEKYLRFWTVPASILIVCILTFGLFLPKLGFYWDDWEPILVARLFPLSEFWKYFSSNRPLAAWTYFAFAPLVGVKPLNWQILALLLRWLTVFSFWWVFCSLWPHNKRQITYAALLFSVYPVFLQQPIAVSYHQHWAAYALYFVSIGCMIQSVRKPRSYWLFTALALISMGLNLAVFEYFTGVEFLRPVILYLLVRPDLESVKKRIVTSFKYWLPFLLGLIVYTIWRVSISVNNPAAPNAPSLLFDLVAKPLTAIPGLIQMVVQDVLYVLVTSWYKTLDPALINLRSSTFIRSFLIGATCMVLIVIYLIGLLKSEAEKDDISPQWLREAAILGGLAVPLGLLPIWLTSRVAGAGSLYSDRFAIVAMFGGSLLLVVLLEWLFKHEIQKIVVIGILVGLASAYQVRTVISYDASWSSQTQFYWQFFWRAPAIQPQTPILADSDLLTYVRPTYPLNLLYSQPTGSRQFAYMYFSLGQTPYLLDGVDFSVGSREFRFTGSSLNSLVIAYRTTPSSCLWVLSPADMNNPTLTGRLRSNLSLSRLDRIQADTPSQTPPPADIFGSEPDHTWCYYYEKADLARQGKQWEQVVRLWNGASAAGYRPKNGPEFIPFIEGFAHLNQWDHALQASKDANRLTANMQKYLCSVWSGIAQTTPSSAARANAFKDVRNNFDCTIP